MLQKYFRTIGAFLLLFTSLNSYSQVSISGPTCGVVGSTSYFNAVRSDGSFNGVTDMEWCVTGGIILQAYGMDITGNSTCKTGTAVNSIMVQWNSGTSGSVSLTTPVGNAPNKFLTISYALNPGTISNTSQTITYNTTPATLNCSVATYGYCTPSYQYQWQKSPDNSTWTDISGATSQNLSFSAALIQTTYYRRRVYETNTSTYAYSNTATVFVNPPFSSPVISPASQDIFSGDAATAITLTGLPTGGNCGGSYSYFWQTSTDGVTYTDNGTNGNVPFSPGAITVTKYYRMRVVCGSETAFSNPAVVNVYQHLATPAIVPSSLTITYNTTPSFSFGSPTGGKCGGLYSYQWYSSPDNINFSIISGATGQNYFPGNLTTTTYFKRVVTCNPETVSSTVTVNVNPELFIGSIAPGNIVIPVNTSPGTLTSIPAGGGGCSGNYNYQWQISTNGSTYTDIAGATSLIYSVPSLSVSSYYRMKVTCGIDIAFSSAVLVTIKSGSYVYNYIQTRDITQPAVTTEASAAALTLLRDVKQATQYFDGLGRPLQTVVKQGSLQTDPLNPTSSAGAVDLVSTSIYDEFGREPFKYLPFASTATGITKNDGNLKLNPFQEQGAFYNNDYATNPIKGQGENWMFSITKFETSPLNRILENFAPGNSWAGTSGQLQDANRHSVKAKFYTNTTIDAVRLWTVTPGTIGTFSTYASPTTPTNAVYPVGTLYKNVTVDEKGKQVIEFKDKEGKIILRKVQLTAAADDGITGSGHAGWLCTYYLYDILNNLRLVVQPRGVELIQPSWALTDATILAEQCFRYEYDARNRMIIKKVPGANANALYMVYDTRDRLVMTQDAKLRALNQWVVTLYDDLNRPVQTGLLMNTYNTPAAAKTFVQHLVDASVSSAYPFAVSTPPASTYWEYLSKTGYDDYSSLPAASGYTPATAVTVDNANINSTYGFFTTYNASPDYAQQIPATASTQTKGMITWTETKVLGTTTYLYAVNLYDEKARLVQVKSKNITTGLDIMTTQYNWAGQPLVNVLKQVKAGTAAQTSMVVTKMIYDDLGRLVQTDKKVQNTNVNSNALPTSYTTISKNEYDALGQLKKKTIGNKKDPLTGIYFTTRQPLQELIYDYNIRGWMLGMNRDYLATEGQTSDGKYFGFELGYDKLTNKTGENFNAAQWNGNIGGMIWKSDGDDVRRKYDFGYDEVNRLLKADFEQQNGDDHAWNNSQVNYTVKMGDGVSATSAYDANGNIKSMTQYGLKLGASPQTPIDQLTYTYVTNSNKLFNVSDAVTPITENGKLGDFKDGPTGGSLNDYTFDANGNLFSDNNKAISSITYNHLNLPLVITVAGKGTITYTYDAAGNKQKKVTVETNATVPYNGTSYTGVTITTTTTYLGGSVFETKAYSNAALASLQYTDKLQYMGHEEGRIRFKPENSTLEYDYMLKDHLGNVRMVLTEELQSDAYPAASMETAQTTTEEALYSNLNTTRIDKPAGYPTDTYTNPNDKVARVKAEAGSQKIGPAIVLKVMAGDKFNIRANSWYKTNGVPIDQPVSPLNDLLAALTGSIGGITSTHGGATATELTNSGVLTPGATSFLNSQTPDATRPKAYLNWVLFDEQFKFVQSSSGAEQVPLESAFGTAPNQIVYTHLRNDLPINKSGYLYVYVSNETPNIDVFFDNLQVTHIRGPILEETHYYPFGLTMAGISSKALNNAPANKYKFNSIEQNNDFDLNMYDAFYRNLDPQIGRFWQIDPKPNYEQSLYSAMNNNPILHADFLGDTAIVFGKNGQFLRFQDDGKKTFSGKMVTGSKSKVTTDANGNTVVSVKVKYAKFSLNDGALVAQAVKNGVINKVEMVSDAKIEGQMDRSGVKTDAARNSPLSYALAEGRQSGAMDYAVQGYAAGDLNKNTLYVTGGIGYDIADFGNFLFGRGIGELGIPSGFAQTGGQYNHMRYGRRGTDVTPLFDLGPGTYGEPGRYDSPSDQRAIGNGYSSSPAVIKAQQEIQQRISNYMQNWQPYQN